MSPRPFLTVLGSALVYAVVACSGTDGATDLAAAPPGPESPEAPASPDAPAQADGGTGVDTGSSRLRPILFQGADGSRALAGWHDSERNEDCSPAMAADGKQRCLSGSFASVRFGDASCTQRVVLTDGLCAPASVRISDAKGTHVHALGKSVAKVYRKQGTSCVVTTVPATSAAASLGDEIPAASFAELTTSVDGAKDPQGSFYASGSRLKVSSIVTADGSRSVVGLFDSARNESCRFVVGGDGKWRCLPDPAAMLSPDEFSNASCTAASASIVETCNKRSSASESFRFAQCTEGHAFGQNVHELTGSTITKVYTKKADNSCVAQTVDTGIDALTVGAMVPPTAFVEATRVAQ